MISLNLNQPSPEAAALIDTMVATLSGNTVAESTATTQPLLSGQPWAAQGKVPPVTQPSFSGQPWAAQGKPRH